MLEETTIECKESLVTEKPPIKYLKKRDIFRFKGLDEEMAINLDHVYKIMLKGKRITFVPIGAEFDKPTSDFVEFQSEEAAANAQNNIISIWSSEPVENS